MEVVEYQEDYFEPLFLFWKRLAEKVPYFFSVSPEKWRECLLDDRLGNEKMFLGQEIFIAIEKSQIVGFSQCIQPAFAWDQNGQQYSNPQIGVLRHFYFDEGRFDSADRLYAKSEIYLNQFANQHAFYHIFGMSCNVHHGKLHQSLAHIDRFLCEKDFRIEHENVYYSLELDQVKSIQKQDIQLLPAGKPEPDTQDYEIVLSDKPIGTIQIRFLDRRTGGFTTDIAYLMWIEIHRDFQRQGWGIKSMQLLISALRSQNYQQLHLDTASTNQIAQRFYEHLGFQDRGRTRCYLKTTGL
jgi:ribosomal protein S18 acetylase RimI-like enzyme